MLRRIAGNERGFTLLEAVVATSILTIGILGTMTLQSSFAHHTTDRQVLNGAVDVATNALSLCRAGETPLSAYELDNDIDVDITIDDGIDDTCIPGEDECREVTITAEASARGDAFQRQFSLTSLVCNFN